MASPTIHIYHHNIVSLYCANHILHVWLQFMLYELMNYIHKYNSIAMNMLLTF
jgi:hypothetical protein